MAHPWRPRSTNRLSEIAWDATLRRIRAEFDEMPGLRVTPAQACVLFGLSDGVLTGVMDRLTGDGFLEWRDGEYMRRRTQP